MKRTIGILLVFCQLLAICTVSAASTEPISLYPAYLQTPLGQPVILEAETELPWQGLVWSSSNASVATVDAEGCVTPVSVGEAVITCSLANDEHISATCGVVVVTEGKILLWKYPPEPVDMDALIAVEEEEGRILAEEEARLKIEELLKTWPDDIPMMEAAVKDAYGDLNGPDGLYIFFNVTGPDVVSAYAKELISLGFKGNLSEHGGVGVLEAPLSGNGYELVHVYYWAGEQPDESICFVQVKR